MSVFSGTVVDTIESGQSLTSLTLTLTNLFDGADERLGADGTIISLVNGNSGSTSTNSLTFSVNVTGGTATVTIGGAGLTAAQMETLIDSLTYQNESNAPNTGDRIITLTQIRDSGGSSDGGNDSVALNITSTVSISSVNNAPTIAITPIVTSLSEDTDTSTGIKIADVVISDDGEGTNLVTLSGVDAGLFELRNGDTELFLKAGVTLDFETIASLGVNVNVDDATILASPEDSQSVAVAISNANDSATGLPSISGVGSVGQTVNADTSGIGDQDGVGTFAYQWTRDGVAIVAATSNFYEIVLADSGSQLRVVVTFTDNDGNLEGPLTSVPLAIATFNVAPTLNDATASIFAGQKLTLAPGFFAALANDADGDPLTAVLVSAPGHGSFSLDPSGAMTYQPAIGFTGIAKLVWKASDGSNESSIATLTFNVRPTVIPGISQTTPNTPSDPVAESSSGNDASDSGEDSNESNDSDSGTESKLDQDEMIAAASALGRNHGLSGGMMDAFTGSQAGELTIAEVMSGMTVSESVATSNSSSTSESATRSDSATFQENSAGTELSSMGDFSSLGTPISSIDYALMTRPGVLWDQLDNYQQTVESRIHGDLILVGSAGAAASSVTAGVVAWALRSGFLLSGMIAHIPAWRAVDPLLIMQGFSSDSDGADGETLEEMMNRHDELIADETDTIQ